MFNELGVARGAAAKALKRKFDVFASREQSHAGIQVLGIEAMGQRASRISRWNIMGMLHGDAGPFLLYHTTHHMTNPGHENMETLLGRTVGVILRKSEIKAVEGSCHTGFLFLSTPLLYFHALHARIANRFSDWKTMTK
ncbi:PREDICTED: uncharacterized protein LOC105128695 [Populus euphratica]|uniref:Uncharacterized protein LOC105128695 n=1 Tax=Populus euphratica TaxID=75702 RepID=A0AAJ6UG44_POPEU|nr:PREDICTED: uncharacterized protein LOC105128695 [Populus euphratica]